MMAVHCGGSPNFDIWGGFIARARTFRCSLNYAKRSFFGAVNGLIGKLLISSFAFQQDSFNLYQLIVVVVTSVYLFNYVHCSAETISLLVSRHTNTDGVVLW